MSYFTRFLLPCGLTVALCTVLASFSAVALAQTVPAPVPVQIPSSPSPSPVPPVDAPASGTSPATAAPASGTSAATATAGTTTAAVVAIPSSRIAPAPGARPAKATHKPHYEFHVKNAGWTDTGIDVQAGEQATVTATGEFSLGDGRTATPDGVERGWKDLLRKFPLNSARSGALIGRVTDLGASVPFAIGANGKVTMPTSGRLFLAPNISTELTGAGEFKVKWAFTSPGSTPVPETPPATAASAPVSAVISPDLFATIPRRVADPQGNPGDMLNFALVGTDEQVAAAFKAAGWVAVDKNVGDAILHGILSTLSHEAYTEMPMSTLILFGRAQDLSFARADPVQVAAVRHHLRIWRTEQTVDGRPLWVGSATHDIGFERDRRTNNGISHKIDPDVDAERQFLLQSFDASGQFSSAAYVTPTDPLREAETATGGTFHSDGRILVMELKR